MSNVLLVLKKRHEWLLLAGAILVSALMLSRPLLILAGVALIVWAAILLGREGTEGRVPLVMVIVVASTAMTVAALVGLATLSLTATEGGGVTLIEG